MIQNVTPHYNASPLCTQNLHLATAGNHVTIRNGHPATTPAHFAPKIRTTSLQRQLTLRQNSHRITTEHHVTIQNSHRTTRALDHNVLLKIINNCSSNFFKRAKHVTIAGLGSRAPLVDHNVLQVLCLPRKMALSCWKCFAGHAKKS